MTYVCPNPTCRKVGCYEHCNSCGESVIWRPPLLDREIAYKGPKPLNQDASVHRCMLNGVDEYRNMDRVYPRRKACVILCPYPDCKDAEVDLGPDNELIDRFRWHLRGKHNHELTEEIGVKLYDRKQYIQENKKISYLDPFLFVSLEEINPYVGRVRLTR